MTTPVDQARWIRRRLRWDAASEQRRRQDRRLATLPLYYVILTAQITPQSLRLIKPIPLSRFDYDGYLAARRQFGTDEWIDLLLQSMGFNPECLDRRSKFIPLVRLIPCCERNLRVSPGNVPKYL